MITHLSLRVLFPRKWILTAEIIHFFLIYRAIKDIKLQNYDIPKGTTILGNIWSLHNDPKYWNEPEKFNPHRFFTADGKSIITRPDSYVPFSYGKYKLTLKRHQFSFN